MRHLNISFGGLLKKTVCNYGCSVRLQRHRGWFPRIRLQRFGGFGPAPGPVCGPVLRSPNRASTPEAPLLSTGLPIWLAFGLSFWFGFGLPFWFGFGLLLWFGFGLPFYSAFGLPRWLAFGLPFWLASWLPVGLVAGSFRLSGTWAAYHGQGCASRFSQRARGLAWRACDSIERGS